MSSPLCSWVTGTSSKACKEDNLIQTQTKRYLRADTSQVTDTLLPRLGGDEGIELVSSLNNGDPASVGEAAEVSTKLKQTILHLRMEKGQE